MSINVSFSHVPLLLIALCTVMSTATASAYGDCDNATYYNGISVYDRSSLHTLLQISHRTVLPYTSTAPDVWEALIDVDSDPSNSSNVHLIYKDISISAEPYGTTDTWNREHVWPKSRGVGYEGADFTDLHALRPADWNVNAARNNRFFSSCGIVNPESDCVTPAHPEAAASTERDGTTFLPPTNVRGDIARAIFYMEMRYDGSDESNVENLTITDCPNENPSENEMAYLSQLIEWHEQDPPDEDEINRNAKVCSSWQGNRNPFVDFPNLVAHYHGTPQTPLGGDGLVYNCSAVPTTAPAPSTTDPSSGSCRGLAAGDIMITGYRSDNPDEVTFVPLVDLPGDSVLYVTDNAWTGNEFRDNEGTVMFEVPSAGIAAGTMFGFGDNSLLYASSWQNEAGTFALSATSDTIHLYCLANSPVHLAALSYSTDTNGWLPPNTTDPVLTFGTGSSSLPDGLLAANAVITLPHKDNYKYNGPVSGTKEELQLSLTNASNWIGSNDVNFNVSSGQVDFEVFTPVLGGGFHWNISSDDPFVDIGFSDGNDSSELIFHYTVANQVATFDIRDYDTCNVSDTTGAIIGVQTESNTSPVKDLDIRIDIVQTDISNSPYYTAAGDLNGTGIIKFCLRVDLILDGVGSVNFREDKVAISIDMRRGFEVTGVSTDRDIAEKNNATATVAYPVQAYQCTSPSSGAYSTTLTQGDICTVCVTTNSTTNGVYVASIKQLDFTQGSFTYQAITNGVTQGLTSVDCQNADKVCLSRTQMISAFFAEESPEPINITGSCIMAFGEGRRLSDLKSRKLQKITEQSSPFDLQVGLKGLPFGEYGVIDKDDDVASEDDTYKYKNDGKMQKSVLFVILLLVSISLTVVLGAVIFGHFRNCNRDSYDDPKHQYLV